MSGADAWKQARQAWRRLAANIRHPSEGDDALAALSDIGVVRRVLDQAELAAVRTARLHGKSWAEIATHLGVARQSAWEHWRDLDDRPGEVERGAASRVLADAAGHLIEMRARECRRGPTVIVPDVMGLEWIEARNVLNDKGLVAIHAEPETPTMPGYQRWIVTDQSPEPGAWVNAGSPIRLWLSGDGGAGVREPRDPHRDLPAKCGLNPAMTPSDNRSHPTSNLRATLNCSIRPGRDASATRRANRSPLQ